MEYSPKGTHVLCDVWGVDFDKLDNLEAIKEVMTQGIEKSGANIISSQEKQFEPNGVTVLFLLSESHFSIHTYPEQGYAGIDCYTCGDKVSPSVAVKNLLNWLNPKRVMYNTVSRGTTDGAYFENKTDKEVMTYAEKED